MYPVFKTKNKCMKDFIRKNSEGKKVLFLFLITNIIYVFMLTVTIPHVMSFSEGKKILDIIPTGYSIGDVNSLFMVLGQEGRDAYLFSQLPVDMVYPLLFGISSCLVLAYLLKRLNKFEGLLFYLCYIPIFSGIFDYGENIGIISMLRIYPDYSDLLTQTTSMFSVLKSAFTVIYFIALIFFLGMFVITKLTKKVS